MAQPITDYTAFFSTAKQAVLELDELKNRARELEERENQLERAVREKEKEIARSIEQTINQRRGEIARSYGSEISAAEDRLKKIRGKRDKAKNQGIKERILEETSGLSKENEELADQIRALFRTGRVPVFCRTRLYYALYLPRGIKEILILLFMMFLCFLAVPCGIYFLIPNHHTFHLVALYVAAIVVFGGLYVVIGNKTRHRFLDVLKEGRGIMNQMAANRKKIASIARSIRKDKNDSVYDLQKFDDEITRLVQELTDIEKKKKEALNTFDTVTKMIISDEIAGNYRSALEELHRELDQVSENLKTVQTEGKEKSLHIADHFEIYVGKDMMTPERLSALAEIISQGEAANITEAISIYKSREYVHTQGAATLN